MSKSLISLGSRDERDRATRAGTGRIAVGASAFLPRAVGRRLTGLTDEEASGTLLFFARVFGIRNIVLGSLLLAARGRPKHERHTIYQVNAAIDAADLAVLAWAAIAQRVPRRFTLLAATLGTNACLAFVELALETA